MAQYEILTKRPTSPEQVTQLRGEVIASFNRSAEEYWRVTTERPVPLQWDNARVRRLEVGYYDLRTGVGRVLGRNRISIPGLHKSFSGDPVYQDFIENEGRFFQVQSGIPTESLSEFLGYEARMEANKKDGDRSRVVRLQDDKFLIDVWSNPLRIKEQLGQDVYEAWIRREAHLIHTNRLKDSPLWMGPEHVQDDRDLAEIAYSKRRLLALPAFQD